MPDTEVRINAVVDGKLISTLEEWKKANIALALSNSRINQTTTEGIKLYKEQSAVLAKSRTEYAATMAAQDSARSKTMKSYFDTGEELRRFYREQRVGDQTMREATQAIGGMSNMLGGEGLGKVVGGAFANFQQMEFAVTGLGIAGQAAGGKLAGLGMTVMSLAGPIAALVGVYALLNMAMEDSKKTAKEYNDELEKQYGLKIKLGMITPGQQAGDIAKKLADLQGGLPALQARADKAKKEFDAAKLDLSEFGGPEMVLAGRKYAEYSLELEKRNTAILELKNQQAEVEKKITDEQKKQQEIGQTLLDINTEYLDKSEEAMAAATKKRTEDTKERNAQLKNEWDFYAKAGRSLGLVSPNQKDALSYARKDMAGKDLKLGEAPAGAKLSAADDAMNYLRLYNKEMTLGEQAIVGVADGVAGLQSAWTGAISGLLTGTQSLGQAFVQMGHAIIAELSAIIAKMIAMSILGNIIRVGAGIATGGASFGGEMATGGLFTSSGSTGSVINKMSESQMGRLPRTGGGSMFSTPPSVTVVPIVNNQGLAVRVEVAGRINTLRRY
jgi:hypothetical protein